MSAYHLFLILHLVSAVALLALLVLVLRNHSEPAAPWFGGVCAALLLWTIAYAFELEAPQLADKLIWANLQFIAATALPLLWLVAVRIAVGKAPPPRWLLAMLVLGALAIVTCVFLNPGHLFRVHPTLDSSGPTPFVAADYGALYYLAGVPFAYGLLTVALFTLGHALLRGPRETRARSALLLAGTALPLASGSLYVAGLLPWPNFNPAMASISVAAVIVACALIYGRLFDVAPLARGTVIEQLVDGVIICDARGRVRDCNPAAVELLPELRRARRRLLADALAGRAELLKVLAAARDHATVAAGERSVGEASLEPLDYGIGSVELWAGDGEGPPYPHHLSVVATPVRAHSGRCRGEAIVLRDVTSGVEALRRLHRIATTDEVTGLLTRGHLFELGGREMDRVQRRRGTLAVMVLDLDGFKAVNDAYGHPAGDELLRIVAAIGRSELRSFDLLARYGGDELAGVLPELGPEDALAVAERLRLAVAASAVWHGEVCLRVTVSIGVACGGRDGESLMELIEAADGALYAAKAAGRDRVALAPSPACTG